MVTTGLADTKTEETGRYPVIEVKITMKDGDWQWINPVLNLTIDNGHNEYDFVPEDIKSIEIYEVKEENDEDL